MTSDNVYVWVWLPGSDQPIPAGVLEPRNASGLSFRYGDRYLDRPEAISLYAPELPLEAGTWFGPTADLGMPGSLRDASPDGWGRRVILHKFAGNRGRDADLAELSESTYLLNSGSDRLGAIDFQRSPTEYVSRDESASLDDLHEAALFVEAGKPLPESLGAALLGGSTIGGARPKALLRDGDRRLIAKFSTSSDPFDVVGAEAASIVLARRAGIQVPNSQIVHSLGRKVLLVERFDRTPGGGRRGVVSALTMLGLGEMVARYGTYPEILDVMRRMALHAEGIGEEIFRRIAFNIAISNTDDHLRNHAAFWDGKNLELTPAYDLSPTSRSGETASQAIAYGRNGERDSNFASLIEVCHEYGLTRPKATALVRDLVESIHVAWKDAADAAELTEVARTYLWGRQVLNPGVLHGFDIVR